MKDVKDVKDVLNHFSFYFEVLPNIWNSKERCMPLVEFYDKKGGKEFMGLILRLSIEAFSYDPEKQKNPILQAAGTLIADNFNDENYSKLFVAKRINLDVGYHALELGFLKPEEQQMYNKVEKMFFICDKNFSIIKVMTLEWNLGLKKHFLCYIDSSGNHGNFGEVLSGEVYKRLWEIICK